MAVVPVARSPLPFPTLSPPISSSQTPRSPSVRASPAFSSPPQQFSPHSRRSTISWPCASASPSGVAALPSPSQQHFTPRATSQLSSFSTLFGSSIPRCCRRPSRLDCTSRISRRLCDPGDVDAAKTRGGSRETRLQRRACSAHNDPHSGDEPSSLLGSSQEEHKPRMSQLLLATLSSLSPSARLKAAGAAVATATVIWLAAALRSTGVLPRVSLKSLLLPPPAHAAVITAADPKPSRLASVAVDTKSGKSGSEPGSAEARAEAGEVVLGESAQQREQGIQEQQQQQQQQKAPQRRQYYEVQGGRRGGVAPARYTAVVRFPKACGILVGTPVRMRGIAVGSVVAVRPSLTSVDVVVEILDEDIVIPRGTPIFVNQSGLIAETLIDMTPLLPIPEYDAGPRDAGCREEGVIVCHRERVEGEIGVSMDEMVRLYVKMGRDAEREKAKRGVGVVGWW
ncbi:unnamed protein product [Closterium sp. Yama58-4]|nr:unnamed protein product [Closterium sp. Yama58-4]